MSESTTMNELTNRRAGAALLLAFLPACSSRPEWRDLDPQRLDARQKERLRFAKASCKALGESLKARLVKAMSEGGAVAAIDACRVAAPEISRSVAAKQNLRIGRTSVRLRNPRNAPPAWAAAHVARAGTAATEAPFLRAGPGGRLGVLAPIPTAGICLNCHGEPEQIGKDVRDALARHYPVDRATGFAVGQLRGWFWVEVP